MGILVCACLSCVCVCARVWVGGCNIERCRKCSCACVNVQVWACACVHACACASVCMSAHVVVGGSIKQLYFNVYLCFCFSLYGCAHLSLSGFICLVQLLDVSDVSFSSLTFRYGGTITTQIKRLGASCDWTREHFTLDEQLSRKTVFFLSFSFK